MFGLFDPFNSAISELPGGRFLTPRARKALWLAAAEARQLKHSTIGTEHLLLGVTKLGEGVAPDAIHCLKLDYETVLEAVFKHGGSLTEAKPPKKPAFSADVSAATTWAFEQSRALGHSEVGTAHLVLAILHLEGAAGRLLKDLNMDVEQRRQLLLKELKNGSLPYEYKPSTFGIGSAVGDALRNLAEKVNDARSDDPQIYFTPRARQAVENARKEATRFNHNFVSTEHLLLGLIRLGQGVALNVLWRLRLDLETIRTEVEKQVATGPDQKVVGIIPFTPRVKKVFQLAAREARSLHHTYVGTEHLLLGLLREGDGVAARVLRNLGIDIERTRAEILIELDPNFECSPVEFAKGPTASPLDTPSGPASEPDVKSKPTKPIAPTSKVRYRDGATEIMAAGRKLAGKWGHPKLAPEHLLVALFVAGDVVSTALMKTKGIEQAALEQQILIHRPADPTPIDSIKVGYTDELVSLLKIAEQERVMLRQPHLASVHLFLALLVPSDVVTRQLWQHFGVDTAALRWDVARSLHGSVE